MSGLPRRRAIVLTVDGWGAGYLGPYGNTWLDTPACNQLANEGLLLENVLVDSPSLQDYFDAVWSGGHAVFEPALSSASLLDVMAQQGQLSRLITDSQPLANHHLTDGFASAECIESLSPIVAASSTETTRFARLLATSLTVLDDASCELLWIHSQGMRAAWDAPLTYREQFRDPDDPPPLDGVEPPVGPVQGSLDPDELQNWVWAYAAQVSVLDRGLEVLLETWGQITDPALLVVMGTRGYALAEHGSWCDPHAGLFGEHLHVPLMIATNRGDLARARCQALIQPYHLFQTLLDWLDLPHPRRNVEQSLLRLTDAESASDAPLAVSRSGSLFAVRTPVWHACMPAFTSANPKHVAEGICQLFLKPDDRWEVNDVASRCPDVVHQFLMLRDQLGALPSCATLPSLLPLHASMLTPPE